MARHVVAGVSLALTVLTLACAHTSTFVVVERSLRSRLDVSPFQRVLIAGFISGGAGGAAGAGATDDVDGNEETMRILRSQLRSKSELRVIDADALDLAEAAGGRALPPRIRSERDMEAVGHVFANAAYWKKVGDEFQQPLIVTGTVLFTSESGTDVVVSQRLVREGRGRTRVETVRTYVDRQAYELHPTLYFIDGRTGATLYTTSLRQTASYGPQQGASRLSVFFDLMDRMLPQMLGTVTTQQVRGLRALIK